MFAVNPTKATVGPLKTLGSSQHYRALTRGKKKGTGSWSVCPYRNIFPILIDLGMLVTPLQSMSVPPVQLYFEGSDSRWRRSVTFAM